MKFRTELQPHPLKQPIGYEDFVLTLGSCFADQVRAQLQRRKIPADGNFMGPLFNPASIANELLRALSGAPVTREELSYDADGWYFHYEANTLLADPDPEVVLSRINMAHRQLRDALNRASHVVVTFGTAWVYRLHATGRIVANCHKQPASYFSREQLSVDQIVAQWSELLEGPLAHKQVIFTVSPIRHLGDSLEGNSVSKAILRVAVDQLVTRFEQTHYFAAYEALVDDLRDYRYYAEDLVHPSAVALDYVWELFSQASFTTETRTRMAEIERLLAITRHNPQRPATPRWQVLSKQTVARMRQCESVWGIDFSEEIARLEDMIYR